MRIRRVSGAVCLLSAFLLTAARLIFGEYFDRLRLERGWEWTFEHPERLAVAVLAILLLGAGLLLKDALRSPALSALVAVFVVCPALLVWGFTFWFFSSSDWGCRIVRFPDSGQFKEAVAVTRGTSDLYAEIYVRRRPGEPMEFLRDLSGPLCTFPFEVHGSPGRPRYLLVDAASRALAVIDLGGDPSWEIEPRSLEQEFGVHLSGVAEPDPIRVMTFNIRYDHPGDGENRWDVRKDLVVGTIRAFGPDVLGLQEVLDHQGRFLRENLEEYAFVGVGRDDGEKMGEFAPVMYREMRFEELGSGYFWLSETPDVPGSMGWDAACSRVATWVRLRDRQAGRTILVLNTHWDHRGETARLESARQVKRFLGGWEDLVVVTGDFNAATGSAPYDVLAAGLRDAHRRNRLESGEQGTFHGFSGEPRGAQIDWILASDEFVPRQAAIDRTSPAGRYPSDHFPVTVLLGWSNRTHGD